MAKPPYYPAIMNMSSYAFVKGSFDWNFLNLSVLHWVSNSHLEEVSLYSFSQATQSQPISFQSSLAISHHITGQTWCVNICLSSSQVLVTSRLQQICLLFIYKVTKLSFYLNLIVVVARLNFSVCTLHYISTFYMKWVEVRF